MVRTDSLNWREGTIGVGSRYADIATAGNGLRFRCGIGRYADGRSSHSTCHAIATFALVLTGAVIDGTGDERLLEAVARPAAPRLQFDCVGPLPPYSFVDLRL